MTTLVASDLLLHIDASFKSELTVDFFKNRQEPSGIWRVYGPEVPWSTVAITEWLLTENKNFFERFRWPHLPMANRHHKTGLPFYTWFSQIARFFATLSGLAASTTRIAFIDLAGFRAFNNAYRQQKGDEVLSLFAGELSAIVSATAIRPDGDEFLLVGAPTGPSLSIELTVFQQRWPKSFRDRFSDGVTPVAPRILVGRRKGESLIAAREELGKAVTALKDRSRSINPEGVTHDLGLLSPRS